MVNRVLSRASRGIVSLVLVLILSACSVSGGGSTPAATSTPTIAATAPVACSTPPDNAKGLLVIAAQNVGGRNHAGRVGENGTKIADQFHSGQTLEVLARDGCFFKVKGLSERGVVRDDLWVLWNPKYLRAVEATAIATPNR
jgi:hypothetical protein